MKTYVTALLLGAATLSRIYGDHFDSSTFEQIAELTTPRNIQVLLEKDVCEALLEVKGPYYLFNPHDGSRVTSGLLGKRFIVRELEDGLKWGEEFPGIHQFYVQPRSPETKIFVNGVEYPGSIAIFGVAGQINIVNDLDIETYVKSILTTQFPTPREPEVLAACAILARTDAYYRSGQGMNSFWHVTAQDTGYSGSALIVNRSLIEKAVDSTKHLILVHSKGVGQSTPFPTTWTENSAGKTAPYTTMFRRDSAVQEKGVTAPHAALSRSESRWSYQIAKKTLGALFDMPKIKSVETFVDGQSNKVYGIRLKDDSDSLDVDFFALQSHLGKKHLQSSDFTVTMQDDSIVFSGYGKGHGVGLCLYSASALAQNGENAVKILSKFFPETYLLNLNAMPGDFLGE
ncbi:MAG: hypothetical protein RL235_675 [Chlamydiota bacterium]|jgi:stage II sporulation protein D